MLMIKKKVWFNRDIPMFTPGRGRKRKSFDSDNYPSEFEDSEDELDAQNIKPDDFLIISGKVENDFSSFQLHVYEHE